ncbi:Phycocyanobilin lyase, CpcS-I subfamily [Acaryochloris thomasi RCC1774]|uniref:Chromophore lyase CpcS/CpeS n=1 Tax=Acaryochloris thomasi RCC1774 TaxID=1764569 RepID=A0A2W1JFU1_9CYAN|nr:phycobiliprotein lyase [Acaryochloris thomasi]PZD72469.1 Phycocyanobilin lyase, CpcS-I subfamily [Acaryochloris thomasi RCC1774]
MEAMEFFRLSEGRWQSQRTTHHLLLRRSEIGQTEILVEVLAVEYPKVVEICHLHQIDASLVIGGCQVSWKGSMAWDNQSDAHEGSTVFVLVPDGSDAQQGKLLRERGYAESVPVVGRYQVDGEGLILTTEYETMSSVERFCFLNDNVRLRTNTVKQFGGFSAASFCTERRIIDGETDDISDNLTSQFLEFTPLGW